MEQTVSTLNSSLKCLWNFLDFFLHRTEIYLITKTDKCSREPSLFTCESANKQPWHDFQQNLWINTRDMLTCKTLSVIINICLFGIKLDTPQFLYKRNNQPITTLRSLSLSVYNSISAVHDSIPPPHPTLKNSWNWDNFSYFSYSCHWQNNTISNLTAISAKATTVMLIVSAAESRNCVKYLNSIINVAKKDKLSGTTLQLLLLIGITLQLLLPITRQ